MDETAAAGPDFSIFGLMMHADPVVQAVMLGLVIASIACWVIIIEKTIRLGRLGGEVRRLETAAATGDVPEEARTGLVGAVLLAAAGEHNEGDRNESRADSRARFERALRAAMNTELRRIEGGLPFLATVGSAAPFVGLFGTVWGIMNSFTSIAQAKDTSLAVVAPGIAEALFATALGLAAAIPAVVAYNQITVALGRAANRGGTAVTELAKKLAQSAGSHAAAAGQR